MFWCLTYTDYLRVNSSGDAAFLIKCTFYWNPINCPLGERWCFPLDWRYLPGCISLFASGTTKGKIMPLYEGKLGHEKATSFLVLRGRIYSLATISSSHKGWKMSEAYSQNFQTIMFNCQAVIPKALVFRTLETSPQGLGIGSVITASISTDPVCGKYIATCLRLQSAP